MNKFSNLVLVIFGYAVIELAALATSLAVSFVTWGMLLYRPNGTTPGDGIGYIIILTIGVPIWIVVALLSPVLAHMIFRNSLESIKRIAFSFLAPVTTAALTAALITWFLESS